MMVVVHFACAIKMQLQFGAKGVNYAIVNSQASIQFPPIFTLLNNFQ